MLLTLSPLMDSVEDDEEELIFDADETIFVAVGTSVERSESALFWAVQNFSGKRICLLHVHQPTQENGELSSIILKNHAVKALRELERQKRHELLNEYLLALAQAGVQADKVWVENENVEIGIVEIITRHNIKWLVMSSSTKNDPLERQAWLNSKITSFVCRQAPKSCQVWVVCRGRLLYTRGSSMDKFENQISPPLLLVNSEVGNESEYPEPEYEAHELIFLDEVEDDIRCNYDSNVGTSKPILLLKDGERREGKDEVVSVQEVQDLLEQAIMDVNNSKRKEFEEVVMRWREEDTTMEAKFKAKALESLCVQEMSKREEIREMLQREKEEVYMAKAKHDLLKRELQTVQEQNSLLESKFEENQSNVNELEEKIVTAVKLLISFKEKRDSLRIEYERSVRELKQVQNLEEKKKKAVIFCRAEIPTFSFIEINEATNEFDPSRKISEGRYGSVYMGNLFHMDVAIKMLPSYGSQSQLNFQYEVEALSRVRHPNLVTIIGACPESQTLVYEYLQNGNLEDRLAGKNNASPLPWEIRIQIASELCSVLIFLHYNKPSIVHGNLKASKILLDANFICKLGGLGIFRLISREKNTHNPSSSFRTAREQSVYFDPEFLETGKISRESDVYSFGVILLHILTGKQFLEIVEKVKNALEMDNLGTVLDLSAGDWPLDLAREMAILALRCCEKEKSNRPDLVSEIWTTLEPMKCIASESFSDPMKQKRIPSHFICPIFQEVMGNPLVAADGFTYEEKAIKEWIESGHNTSPMTNLKLEHCNLVPNYALQNAIHEWHQHL